MEAPQHPTVRLLKALNTVRFRQGAPVPAVSSLTILLRCITAKPTSDGAFPTRCDPAPAFRRTLYWSERSSGVAN